MLEVYPNNYELLSYSLGHIDGLLDELKQKQVDEEEYRLVL